MLRKFLLILLLAAAVGCTAVAEPELPATPTPIIVPTSELKDRTLQLFWWQAPSVINPHLTAATADRDAARIIYEPLASFNAEGELVPVLAVEVPTVENGLLDPELKWVRWRLQDGLRWSDGEAMTAHDLKFTYKYVQEQNANTRSAYAAIESIDILDDLTVQINFGNTNPSWAVSFVGPEGMIIPEHVFGGDAAVSNPLPVGTGPYRLLSADTEEVLFFGNRLVNTVKLIYETNPYYRNLDDLYFQRVVLNGGGTAVEAASSVLEFGDVDFAYNLQLEGEELEEMVAAGNNHGRLVSSLGGRVEHLTLIRNDPADPTYAAPHPFFSTEADPSNQLVVQAIAHAIDREPILALYGVTGEAAHAIIMAPPTVRSDNVYYAYDLDRARELLAMAGWVDEDGDGLVEKDGRRLSLIFRTSQNAVRQETQNIIQQSLNEIGIDVELSVSGDFFTTNASLPDGWLSGSADIVMFTNGNQIPDPTSYLGEWQCARIPEVDANGVWQGRNIPRWCSEAYDALYNQANVETDAERRQELLKDVNDMLVENVIVIPLVSRARISGARSEIVGIELTPWDSHLWNVHEWRRVAP